MSDLKILMVQSNADSIANYRRMLSTIDCEIIEATSTAQALQRLRKTVFPVIITGLELPSTSGRHGGIEILLEIQHLRLPTQTIVITANTHRDVDQIMQYGAFDYFQRPVDAEKLMLSVERAYKEYSQLALTRRQTQSETKDDDEDNIQSVEALLGDSRLLQQLRDKIDQLTHTQDAVLFFGEQGVGKALAAMHVQHNSNQTENVRGFLDCAQLERLQHRAFIEILSYRDGTLIIDNIHTLTRDTLPIFESMTNRLDALNTRMLMTSQYGLDALRTLYASMEYSLADVLPSTYEVVWIPPLRERADGQDIRLLAQHFLAYYSQDQLYAMKFRDDALEYLSRMDFAVGNVRELRSLVFAVAQATYELGEQSISRETIDRYIDQVVRESRPIRTRQVFVSHSSKDKDFVVPLLKELDSPHLSFWVDHERIMDGSPAWFDEINKGLQHSDAMLLVVSPESMASDEVKSEWNYFLRVKKPILPLIYKPAKNMNYRLQKLQAVTWADTDAKRLRDGIVNILKNAY